MIIRTVARSPRRRSPTSGWPLRREFISRLRRVATAAAVAPRAPRPSGPGSRASGRGRSAPAGAHPYEDVITTTTHEFGATRGTPRHAGGRTCPGTTRIDGEARSRRTTAEDLISRTPWRSGYRLRCGGLVDGDPVGGVPARAIARRLSGTLWFVEFTTLLDPRQMPGQRDPVLEWPYVEGLWLDEATHPLAILAVALYGVTLPNQNGAPLRLVVPWKYGFKSIKAIVRIRFVEKQPVTAWQRQNPREYGFYSNVNPEVDHPRWSGANGDRRVLQAPHADVQRVRRPGGKPLRGDGPAQELLSATSCRARTAG